MTDKKLQKLIEIRRSNNKTWQQIASEWTARKIKVDGKNTWSRHRVSRWYKKHGVSGPVLMLRTCRKSLRSYKGFQWPSEGYVEAPDWNPEPCCGGGLHGLPWGAGDGTLLDWSKDAKWLVFEADEVVRIDGDKAKAPSGVVVYCGDRKGATDYIVNHTKYQGQAVTGAFVIVGHYDKAVAGQYGMATAGYKGTATAGYGGKATAGHYGKATAGGRGRAMVGVGGTASAGDEGTLVISWWNEKDWLQRIAVAYVGEDGIKPNTAYKLDDKGNFMEFVE